MNVHAEGCELSSHSLHVWVIVACAGAIGLGTMAGGKRIIKTMGTKIIKISPLQGFAAETAGALTIMEDTHAGTCGVQPPPQSWLTADGIRWAYNYSAGPGGDQAICAPKSIDGGYMSMYYYWRGHAQARRQS